MRDERVEFRTSHQERRQLEMAASSLRMNLSAFLRQAALEKSSKVLEDTQTLVLSNRDRDLFLKALEKPPKPNKNLRKAFSDYHRAIRKK